MRRKNLIMLLITLYLAFNCKANDTITTNSDIKRVVVFLKGAQVNRSAKCILKSGKNIINFTKLTSQLDEKSVQVKSDESVAIQSVNFTVNYMDSLNRKNTIKKLQSELQKLTNDHKLLESKIYVLNQEQDLLKKNQVLGGDKKVINTDELKIASAYYREQLTQIIKLRKKVKDEIKDTKEKQRAINQQLNELNQKKALPVGEILVIAYVTEPKEFNFSIEYFITEAGWKPKYDVRAESVSKPAILSYKADVFQNTDDDWSNVQLILSSSNPSLGGTKPVLKSWVIDVDKQYSSIQDNSNYDNSVKYYDDLKNDYSSPITVDSEMTITGIIADSDGGAIPGANVRVEGFSDVGTITDLDGKYSLNVPEGAQKLVISFVGMKTESLPITGSIVDGVLENEDVGIDEVVVTALGVSREKKAIGYAVTTLVNDGLGNFVPENSLAGRASGIQVRGNSSLGGLNLNLSKLFKRKRKLIGKSLVGLNSVKENQTSVQFVLDKPYTIPSDNKNYSVDIEKYEIPVHYQYSTVPKIDETAFLQAELTGWEKLNLISGRVNIYFEGSFVGNSNLDVNNTKDTLGISLGRDKSIIIDRKLKKDFTHKQVLSKGKVVEYAWEITVKNTKSDSVSLTVEDQIPVSFFKNMEVELLENSNAEYDKLKGELKWNLKLEPYEKKTLNFTYRIKTKNR